MLSRATSESLAALDSIEVLLRIWKFQGSIVGLETSYRAGDFS